MAMIRPSSRCPRARWPRGCSALPAIRLVAALLGAGAVADAFLVAFQLVNVVRRLLTEGALNAALVPAYLRIRETEGAAAAAAFAGRLLGTVSVALMAARC